MNYNLNADEINTIKKSFSAWLELQDEKKSISEAEKDLKKQAAEAFDGNASQAGKLFHAMKQLADGEDNELDELGSVLEALKGDPTNTDMEGN